MNSKLSIEAEQRVQQAEQDLTAALELAYGKHALAMRYAPEHNDANVLSSLAVYRMANRNLSAALKAESAVAKIMQLNLRLK